MEGKCTLPKSVAQEILHVVKNNLGGGIQGHTEISKKFLQFPYGFALNWYLTYTNIFKENIDLFIVLVILRELTENWFLAKRFLKKNILG